MNRLLLLALFAPIFCSAQVDSLSRRKMVTGRISLDGSYQSGNLEQRLVRGTFAPVFEFKKLKVTPFLQYSYGRIFTNVLQDDVFAYVTADFPKAGLLYFNIAAMFETSKLRSIEKRWVAGPGVGLRLIDTEKNTVALVHSIIYNETEFVLDNTRNYSDFAYGLALRGKSTTNKAMLTLNYTVFYQTNPGDFSSNNRLRGLLVLSLPIVKNVSINITGDYIYEDIVDDRRKRNNFISLLGVSWKI